jgi:AhpD family alkylhydroperoxidase
MILVMPRLREVPLSEVTDPTIRRMYQQLFDGRDPVTEPGTATGTPGNWWSVFAVSPDVFSHAVAGFGLYEKSESSLDPKLRELAQTRAGWARGSQFVFSQHCKGARNAGVTEEQIAAIPSWSTAECFSPVERAVLAYTDALVLAGGRVPDELFATLRTHLDDVQIMMLTYITVMYEMHATISRALRLEYDDRDDPIVEIAAPAGSAGLHISMQE